MYYKKKLPWIILLLVTVSSGFVDPMGLKGIFTTQDPITITLSSSDSLLVELFNWSKATSNSHVGNAHDPVGPWYEAALPNREAFCIRDVSHQCIGNEILGQAKENQNMMEKFVKNISQAKDFCSFWEINRYNRPAPVDYHSDQDFWYNLNANFDIIDASFKLYQWTGNSTYIRSPAFDRFFRLTLNQYIKRWQLEPDKIMQRPVFMNRTAATVKFKEARGIPSYDEAQDNITIGADLLAMIANGFSTYSKILQLTGESAKAVHYQKKAMEYTHLLDSLWWDPTSNSYFNFYTTDHKFYHGGNGKSEFLLWYQVIHDPLKIAHSLVELQNSQTEVLSYLPMIFYRYGFPEKAYDYLKQIYRDPRRMYPEASSATIEGIVSGLMGIEPSASENRIATCPRLPVENTWVKVENIPVFSGVITVQHVSSVGTIVTNKSSRAFTWRAVFRGNHQLISVDGKDVPAQHFHDALQKVHSYVDIPLSGHTEITATAL